MKLYHASLFPLLTTLLVLSGSCSKESPSTEDSFKAISQLSILEKVRKRGHLVCGVSGELPGFSYADLAGISITELDNDPESSELLDIVQENISGFDVDICRAIAAAIFDNPKAVKFRLLDTKDRFEEITSGKIDVLSRTTTWTIKRDISDGVEFAPTVFYDGQGVMVRKASDITSINDLEEKSVCVETETTSEANLRDEMRKLNVEYVIRPLQKQQDLYRFYESEECQAVTADSSQLAINRALLKDPEDHIILEKRFSKEPLAPAVVEGDQEWLEVVRWVVFALLEAEELEISQSNVQGLTTISEPRISRFLGVEDTQDSLGKRLNLSSDFAHRIVKHVGNYGEIYERNLGVDSAITIDRGRNHLWTDLDNAGLMYSPPFR